MIGDLVPSSIITAPPILYCCSTPTAIVRIETPRGFVVASDGLSQNSITNTENDATQKVFRVNAQPFQFAYAIAGTVLVTPKEKHEELFDVYSETEAAMRYALLRRPTTLFACASIVGERLYTGLRKLKSERPDAFFLEDDPSIFRIWFAGYCYCVPETALLEFRHEDQVPTDPAPPMDPNGWRAMYGSDVIAPLLEANDERFSTYRHPLSNWRDRTLNLYEATAWAKGFIEAHKSSDARSLDRRTCPAIGGRILIVTITSDNGAQWVEGFAPDRERDPLKPTVQRGSTHDL